MTQADSVHSTPRTAAPKPSPDDLTGMAWWNALTEKERRYWMRLAGDTGRAVDAWRAYKAQLSERGITQDERSWRAGYAAGYTAKLAGKPTLQAPRGVDGLSYASGAIEGAAAGERYKAAQGPGTGRELDPQQVLVDLFEELAADDPQWLSERVIERLRDSGFTILPTTKEELPQTSRASHQSGS